ncbi:Oxidoreductase [Rhizina undulata]
MFRPALRTVLRRQISTIPRSRTLFTSATPKKSSFKSTVARWALAGGLVYYYTTSNVFADEPTFYEEDQTPVPVEERPPSQLSSRQHKRTDEETYLLTGAKSHLTHHDAAVEEGGSGRKMEEMEEGEKTLAEGGPEALAEEADAQGAFNPETGEINWDCPCLGGMAHGPCGEEFKSAFSCFIYSTEEPKGVDCIEKFKRMQTCFQQYPEIYGGELTDEEESETESPESEPPTPSPQGDHAPYEVVEPETRPAETGEDKAAEKTEERAPSKGSLSKAP